MQAYLDRPLEGDLPYIWIDATYLKVRRAGRIFSVAVTIAVGVHSDDRREVLGIAIGPSEAGVFWTDFLRGIARRDLRAMSWRPGILSGSDPRVMPQVFLTVPFAI